MFEIKTKLNLLKTTFAKSSKVCSLVIASMLFTACMPSEKTVTQDDLSSELEFKGVASVQTISDTQLKVLWEKSAKVKTAGYKIYDVKIPSEPVLVGEVGKDSTQIVFSGLNTGFIHKYRVKAVDEFGNEDDNKEDAYGIPYAGVEAHAEVYSSTAVDVNFAKAEGTESLEVKLYCKNENAPAYVLMTTITDLTQTKYRVNGLLPNIDYTCKTHLVIEGKEDNNTKVVVFKALGRAHHLVFVTNPNGGPAGEIWTQQPEIHILDENDNIVAGGPDADAVIMLTIAPGSLTGGTPTGGQVSLVAIGGVATFADLYMEEAGLKILRATKSATDGGDPFGTPQMTVDSNQFLVTYGTPSADQSSITVTSSTDPVVPTADGLDYYDVLITVRDQFGNPIDGISPEFGSNTPGDIYTPSNLPTDLNGEATGQVLTTIADTNGPSVRLLNITVPASLNSLTVPAPFDPGPATKLTFTVQPSNSPAGNLGLNELQVSVQDLNNNTIVTGTDASTSIAVSISNNVGGANLTGTGTKVATNGVAVFDDLGIDQTGNGYRLSASGGVLSPVNSNNFNITAGIPRVITMTGSAEVLSGGCSTLVTLQLQDFGGNEAKATQNTTVQIAGLGSAALYADSSCVGAVQSTNQLFTPGVGTKSLYIKSEKVESLTITGTDASSVLTSSSYPLLVTPNKMRMVAEAAPPAPGGTKLTVTAGQCSTAIKITPLANDGSPGQVFSATNISMVGLTAEAEIYSDAACTNLLDESSFPMTIGAPPGEDTLVYLKDPKGESLTLTVADPAGNINPISLPQQVDVLASDIDFVGPATVVAGQCSAVFTITLKDTLNNNVPTTADTTFDVVGMTGSPTGQFYTSPSCAGGSSNTSVIVPNGSAITTVYYKGLNAEILNIYIADPLGAMNDSQIIQLTVSPSDFRITVAETDSGTSECAGPFDVETLDGSGTVANVVETTQADLSGAGDAGKFYAESTCDTEITSLTFNTGQSLRPFYFKGQYPEASLTLTAADNGGILNADTQAWTVTSDIGWLGSSGKQFSSGSTLLPFRTGFQPVGARVNGVRQAMHLAMDPTHQYLYVADYGQHRLLKYDYTNGTFIGWTGRLRATGGLTVTGSNVVSPTPAECITTPNAQILPGWCLGADSYAATSGYADDGGFYSPWGVAADNTYVYVSNYSSHMISRMNAETGAFDGWIGTVYNVAPTGDATGGAGGCTTAVNNTTTPGWCIGGRSRQSSNVGLGNGNMYRPRGVTQDALYLYVAAERAVFKFDKATGAFVGWIGRVTGTPTGGEPGCTLAVSGDVTPGWCIGGTFGASNPTNTGFVYNASSIVIDGTDMYILNDYGGGRINKYNVTTGAFIETLNGVNGIFNNPRQMMMSGGKLYIAADERIARVTTTGTMDGWMGKVANNVGMFGNPGCNSLSPNDNTPGWCLGGSQKAGLDEEAFIDQWGITDAGDGNLLTISYRRPAIKKFDIATGVYQGAIGMESTAPTEWNGDRTIAAEQEGSDDGSFYNPGGTHVAGDYLYVADRNNSRIKKINLKTGSLVGWLGGMTTKATGGLDASCLVANAMSPSPTYCTGALPYPSYTWNDAGMIDDLADGIMREPYGLTDDGTWLYVTDSSIDRIQRFNLADGSYGGWIGKIYNSGTSIPTGGAPGCSSAPQNTFTPGWCLGGRSQSGTGDGMLNEPTSIVYHGGNLYVIDSDNHRVSSYNATTGAFNGWIGRINAAPSSGCTVASNGNYNVSTLGWCLGGTARTASRVDRGGGFYFEYGTPSVSGISTDGSYLYVGNTRNSRIDRINFDGSYDAAVRVRSNTGSYNNVWQTAPADIAATGNNSGGSYAGDVWIDGGYIYGVESQPYSRSGDTFKIYKMDITTGNTIGWKGGIDANTTPSGGDPGCAGATSITPGWCTGGVTQSGARPSQFSYYRGSITGDAHFIYVTDGDAGRVVRLPK